MVYAPTWMLDFWGINVAPPIIPVIIPVIPSPGKLGIRVQCGAGPLEVLEAAGVDGGASGEVAMAKKTQEMVFAWEKIGLSYGQAII